MTLAASSISEREMSSPEILNKIPLAPLQELSSKGELIAKRAAISALFSPSALPIPNQAVPESSIISLISAKLTLIMPGSIIKSEIP